MLFALDQAKLLNYSGVLVFRIIVKAQIRLDHNYPNVVMNERKKGRFCKEYSQALGFAANILRIWAI